MNIAFDASAILSPMSRNRGIGNYTLNQFKALIQMDKKNNYFFFNMLEQYSMETEVDTDNVKDCYFFSGNDYDLLIREEYKDVVGDIIKRFIRENEIDVFYITSPFEPRVSVYEKEWFQGTKTVATVYDIIPYVMRDKYLKKKDGYENYMKRVEMLRWVDECLVISQSVKDDLISYLNFPEEKIHVIYAASNPEVFKKRDISEVEKDEIRGKYKIVNKFIMCTGGDDERKNLAGLIKAYAKIKAEVREQYQLVIVCKLSKESVERYTKLTKGLRVEERVVLTNFVTEEELVMLYNMADLMVFPSLYEGFGLPIIEAWMCGTPVLTSTNSSLQEIGGDAAVLVDADSVKSIARGIEDALTKEDLRELGKRGEERQKLFSWERVSEETMRVIEGLKKVPHEKEDESVRKIAMFTPLPPLESGISDYSVDILSQLSSHFEIDVFIERYEPDVQIEGVTIYPFKQFKKNYKKYDRIIYQVGNSMFHEYMFPFIKKYPGIVVLHDYNLKNVLEEMYIYKSRNEEVFKECLREDYDEDETEQYMKYLNTSYRNNFEINGFVTNYARRIVVHSEYAKNKLIEKEVNRDVSVIPLYSLIDEENNYEKSREEIGIDKSEVIFAAFGHIHPNKRILQILSAFARIHKKFPQAKLYFVGKLSDEFSEIFYNEVKKYGIMENVQVTGYVTLEEFEKYMDATDVCLNLRYPYNGESSASFMRMLGKGKCAIINRIGSFAEVPENACIMIDNAERLSEQEEVEQIYQAMLHASNKENRSQIEKCAKEYAQEVLDLHKVGEKYIQMIKTPYKKRGHLTDSMLKSFSQQSIQNGAYDDDLIKELAKTFAYSLEP